MEETSDNSFLLLHDNELAALTVSGEKKALQEITRRYRQRLYDIAMAMLFSPRKAEAAVNSTLHDLELSIKEFRGDSLFLTWICRKLIRNILNGYFTGNIPADLSGKQAEKTPEQ